MIKLETNSMRLEIFSFTGDDGNKVDMCTFFYSDSDAKSRWDDNRSKPFGKLVAGLDVVCARANDASLFNFVVSTTKFPCPVVLEFEQETRQRNQVLILRSVKPLPVK